jgi:hypothetical protein
MKKLIIYKSKLNIVVCLLIFFAINDVFSQLINHDNDSVWIYTDNILSKKRIIGIDTMFLFSVINSDFRGILDSFIIHEQQYEYYDSTVVFFVNINIYDSGLNLWLFSGDKNIGTEIKLAQSDYLKKMFVHKNHIFLSRINCFGLIYNNILNELFQKTDKKIVIVYYKNIETEIEEIESFFIEDDSYFPTTWIYDFYLHGRFFIEKLKTDLYDQREK